MAHNNNVNAPNAGSIYCHQQLQPVPASPPPSLVMAAAPPPLPANLYQYLPPAYAALLAAQQHQQFVQHQQQSAVVPSQQEYAEALSAQGSRAGSFIEQDHYQAAGPSLEEMQDGGQAAHYSTVSQIEATPLTDPETGEAIFPCPFCEKSYGGKHGRSIWRRHLSNKHGIPLHVQPRKTRWDNGASRDVSLATLSSMH